MCGVERAQFVMMNYKRVRQRLNCRLQITRMRLALSVRSDLYWRLAGVSGRGQHLSLRLETGSYRGGREAVCSRLASNTASVAAAFPLPLPPSTSPPPGTA